MATPDKDIREVDPYPFGPTIGQGITDNEYSHRITIVLNGSFY